MDHRSGGSLSTMDHRSGGGNDARKGGRKGRKGSKMSLKKLLRLKSSESDEYLAPVRKPAKMDLAREQHAQEHGTQVEVKKDGKPLKKLYPKPPSKTQQCHPLQKTATGPLSWIKGVRPSKVDLALKYAKLDVEDQEHGPNMHHDSKEESLSHSRKKDRTPNAKVDSHKKAQSRSIGSHTSKSKISRNQKQDLSSSTAVGIDKKTNQSHRIIGIGSKMIGTGSQMKMKKRDLSSHTSSTAVDIDKKTNKSHRPIGLKTEPGSQDAIGIGSQMIGIGSQMKMKKRDPSSHTSSTAVGIDKKTNENHRSIGLQTDPGSQDASGIGSQLKIKKHDLSSHPAADIGKKTNKIVQVTRLPTKPTSQGATIMYHVSEEIVPAKESESDILITPKPRISQSRAMRHLTLMFCWFLPLLYAFLDRLVIPQWFKDDFKIAIRHIYTETKTSLQQIPGIVDAYTKRNHILVSFAAAAFVINLFIYMFPAAGFLTKMAFFIAIFNLLEYVHPVGSSVVDVHTFTELDGAISIPLHKEILKRHRKMVIHQVLQYIAKNRFVVRQENIGEEVR